MAMVAGRYGSHHTLHELRDLSGCGRDGMTLFHMRQLSENLGFDAKVYRAGAAELPHVRLPAIAFWSDNHYVVIDQIKDRHVNIIDPAIGQKTQYRSFSRKLQRDRAGDDPYRADQAEEKTARLEAFSFSFKRIPFSACDRAVVCDDLSARFIRHTDASAIPDR